MDDDEDIRGLLRDYLERENYSVLEAENGRIALERIKSSQPDLIILDGMMPGPLGSTTVGGSDWCDSPGTSDP